MKEIRSVQKTGGASYSITLPKQWINAVKLDSTEFVECSIHPTGSLTIRPHRKNGNRKATIIADDMEIYHLKRLLVGYYVSGMDEIEILCQEFISSQRSVVRNLAYKFTGFEIVRSTSNQIVLRNVLESMVQPHEYVERMFEIVMEMCKDLIVVVSTPNPRLCEDIIDRDEEADKIHLTVDRQLHILLSTLIIPEDSSLSLLSYQFFHIITIRLERIADHIVQMAEVISRLKIPAIEHFSKSDGRELHKAEIYISQCREMVKEKNLNLANMMLDDYKKSLKDNFIDKKMTGQWSTNLIRHRLERIKRYCVNIAEETINYCCAPKY